MIVSNLSSYAEPSEKYSFNPEEEHLLGQEELDIMPSENESGEFQAPNALFTCEDYLLDIEAGESITKLDYHLAKGSQNLVFESCTQANRAGYSSTPQELGLSSTTNHVHDFHENLVMNDYDANGIFSCSADSEMSIEDRWFKYSTSFPVESIEKLEDVSSMFSNMNEKNIIFNPGLTSEEIFCPSITEQHNEYSSVVQNAEGESNIEQDVSGCPIQAGSVGPPSEKRLRKPPHRFIDELSQPNSRVNRKRRDISTPTSKVKTSKVKHQKHDDIKSTAERSFAEESAGKAIQVPFGPLICKENQKKQELVAPQVLHSEPVASVAVSDEDCVSRQRKQIPIATKGLHLKPLALVTTSKEDTVSVVKSGEDGGRRKHHILWTVSEVKKLIDGVSQYGVGRWSHIKKDLFSSSAHRTAVDLKDKWRNLLKATCVQNEGKKGIHEQVSVDALAG